MVRHNSGTQQTAGNSSTTRLLSPLSLKILAIPWACSKCNQNLRSRCNRCKCNRCRCNQFLFQDLTHKRVSHTLPLRRCNQFLFQDLTHKRVSHTSTLPLRINNFALGLQWTLSPPPQLQQHNRTSSGTHDIGRHRPAK